MNPNPTKSWLRAGNAFVPCDAIPISDRGFRHGMAVFESLPVLRGAPLFLPQHCERLRAACADTGLLAAIPAWTEFEALLRGVPFDAFARIYVTAGDGGVSGSTEHGRVFVFAEPQARHQTFSNDGYRLATHPAPHTPLFPGLKTANYWANIAALRRARENQCDEALLFHPDGSLISACMANVFIVRNGKFETPSISSGARPGVIREWVMRRRSVAERHITPGDLRGAGELFITNSRLGIMPAASLDGRLLASRAAAAQLRVEYEKEISEVAAGG